MRWIAVIGIAFRRLGYRFGGSRGRFTRRDATAERQGVTADDGDVPVSIGYQREAPDPSIAPQHPRQLNSKQSALRDGERRDAFIFLGQSHARYDRRGRKCFSFVFFGGAVVRWMRMLLLSGAA